MAATWIKSLHRNFNKTIAKTLAVRTDYAKNPDKTHDGVFVTGYECDPHTAAEEFLFSKSQYDYFKSRDLGNRDVIAYHVRQSFKPDEITPEEANEIGRELALSFFKGKHAFIVATHIDKRHIHNHIIANSTTLDCHGKFHDFKGSYWAIRRISDLLCLQHGLSIIKNPKLSKGKNYGKWLDGQGNKSQSWSDIIRQKLDDIIPKCKTFDELIEELRQAGFIVNDSKKYVSVLAPEQKRPIRFNSLGEGYTQDEIRERLAGLKTLAPKSDGGGGRQFSLLIDIQAKIAEGKGKGYEEWSKIFNLKQSAKTLIWLQDNGIDSYDDLVEKAGAAKAKFNDLNDKIKSADQRLKDIAELQKQIATYSRTSECYKAYKASGKNADFYEVHRADITLHEAAKRHFDSLGKSKLPSINQLKQEYAQVAAERKSLYSGYKQVKENSRELTVALQNSKIMLKVQEEPKLEQPKRQKEQEI